MEATAISKTPYKRNYALACLKFALLKLFVLFFSYGHVNTMTAVMGMSTKHLNNVVTNKLAVKVYST